MFIVAMRDRFLFVLLRENIGAIKDDGDACRQLIILTPLGVCLAPAQTTDIAYILGSCREPKVSNRALFIYQLVALEATSQ